jgi:CTP:molybdopterin cytidylyltransferase MocA
VGELVGQRLGLHRRVEVVAHGDQPVVVATHPLRVAMADVVTVEVDGEAAGPPLLGEPVP